MNRVTGVAAMQDRPAKLLCGPYHVIDPCDIWTGDEHSVIATERLTPASDPLLLRTGSTGKLGSAA